MIFCFTPEQEKYLVQVTGKGWNCVVKTTPPELVEWFKGFNKYIAEQFHEEPVVHFI